VFDEEAGEDVVLTDKQVEKIKGIALGRYPVEYDPYEPLAPPPPVEVGPISEQSESKRSQADQRRMVNKIVHAIKMGWVKLDDDEESDEGSDYGDYEWKMERVEVRLVMGY